MKDYKKVIDAVGNEKIIYLKAAMTMIMVAILPVLFIGGDSSLFFCIYSFLLFTLLTLYQHGYPLIGSQVTAKGIAALSQMREIYGGSNMPYDILCVLPTSHREIGEHFLKAFRRFNVAVSAELIICALSLLYSDNPDRLSAAAYIYIPMIMISFSFLFLMQDKVINIIGWILYIGSMVIMVITTFAGFADVWIVPDIPIALRIILAVFPLIFNEIFCRVTILNKNKLYARNGEAVRRDR